MHPEIIKDSPGTCDVCGMPLVTAESLGYVNESKYSAPLVIPVTSVLRTGKRAIVYLALKNEQKPTFESRQIILGPRLGHYYLIEKGLKEGDRVVTKGAFKIDAEMQIQAKPGMMSLENSKIPIVASNISKNKINTLPEKFILQLENFIDFYFKIHKQLTKDSPVKVNFLSKEALKTLQEIEINLLTEKTLTQWMNQFKDLTKAMQKLSKSKNLEIQREIFSILSVNLEKTLRLFPIRNTKVFKASCPMAFKNKGASWLQKTRDISNPYFGESMINCGKIEDEILAGDGEKINDL
jgi:Cu(I)/Ag(I) efflux system membrane fusion protein